MEKKFYCSNQKHFELEATAPWNEYTNNNNNKTTSQEYGNNGSVDDPAKIPSSHQQPLISDEDQRSLHDLAGEYQKLVHSIKWRLPQGFSFSFGFDSGSGSVERLAAGTSQALPRYGERFTEQSAILTELQRHLRPDLQSREEQRSNCVVGFVELLRQRMHYDRLGIPLTPLELIYMGDRECRWRRRKQTEAEDGQVRHQDSGTQTEPELVCDCGCGTIKPWPEPVPRTEEPYHEKPIRNRNSDFQSNPNSNLNPTDNFDCDCCCCAAVRQIEERRKRRSLKKRRAAAGHETPNPTASPISESDEHVELTHRLRRTPKIVNLPGRVAAQRHAAKWAARYGDSSGRTVGNEVKVLLAPRSPRSPRLLLNERQTPMKETSSLTERHSEPEQEQRVSAERARPGYGSNDTLNEVWNNPSGLPPNGICGELPLDARHADWAGAPRLGEEAARAALERGARLSREFEQLSREQRGQRIAMRLRQLRQFQEQADRSYACQLRSVRRRRPDSETDTGQQGLQHECPLRMADCPRLLNESLLAHFLEVHLSEPGLALSELYERDQVLIMFQPRTFKRSRNVCLSMIVYAGRRDKSCELPAMHYLPCFNAGLSRDYVQFAGHMPLFVMACRTRLPQEKPEEEEVSAPGENVMALWMVSMELPEPVHVHMAVFNRRLDISRSCIVQVRGIHKCQNCDQFMARSRNYLRLTGQDLRLLTNNFMEPIYLELSVRDYDVVSPPPKQIPP